MSLRFGWKAWGRGMGFFFVFLMAFHFESKADEGKVGEIRYSILTLKQFQELYGPQWELMAGQTLSKDSELFPLWGKEKLPDARGVYLRSANHGRVATEGNPHGDADAGGAYLKDQVLSHTHPVHLNGTHFISRAIDQCEWKGGFAPGIGFADQVTDFTGQGFFRIPYPRSQSGIIRVSPPQPVSFGGSETRPRSLVVNTYIKVRESQPEKSDPSETFVSSSSQVQAMTPETITPEMMKALIARPEFQEAVKDTVREMMNQRKR